MALIDRLIASSIGLVPKFVVGRIATRYVAGETLDQALATARALNEEGCRFTLDLLGEFETDDEKAEATARAYHEMLDRISEGGYDGNVSIKLTAIGLMASEDRTYERLQDVVAHAERLGNTVRIDMEDSPYTDRTIGLYRRLREAGHDGVGLVFQSYLRRLLDDTAALAVLKPSYRLCKGIYVEPEEIAFKDAEEIRVNYLEVLDRMLGGAASFVGIATHDENLVERSLELLKKHDVPKERYEFQMLLGVTEGLRKRLVDAGHPMRVYIPFGEEWYGYVVRRLKENPKIGRYVLLALFRRG